jgi:hypothetical protein
MASGATSMARPKPKPKPKPKGKAASPAGPENRTVINMKGTVAYIEWLEAVHRKTHIPKAQIVRLALADWAKANGHQAPPEI